jgi:hypothetical protein
MFFLSQPTCPKKVLKFASSDRVVFLVTSINSGLYVTKICTLNLYIDSRKIFCLHAALIDLQANMIQKLACGLRNRRRRKSLLTRVLFFVGLLCFASIFHSLTSTGVQYIRSGNSKITTVVFISTTN